MKLEHSVLYTECRASLVRTQLLLLFARAVIASIVLSVSARFEEKEDSPSFPSASAGINHLYL